MTGENKHFAFPNSSISVHLSAPQITAHRVITRMSGRRWSLVRPTRGFNVHAVALYEQRWFALSARPHENISAVSIDRTTRLGPKNQTLPGSTRHKASPGTNRMRLPWDSR